MACIVDETYWAMKDDHLRWHIGQEVIQPLGYIQRLIVFAYHDTTKITFKSLSSNAYTYVLQNRLTRFYGLI